MKKFLLGTAVGCLLGAAAVVVVAFAMLRLARRPPDVPGDATLVLRLEGSVPEVVPLDLPLAAVGRRGPIGLGEYWDILRKAAVDRRIRAVVVMPENLETGWAKLEQLRESLERFRRSGKPLYAWLRRPGTREYFLAVTAERVYMGPEDYLDFKGLRLELIYLRDTLQKLGIEVEVATSGKYKDAPDMFTRRGMSPQTREVLNSILDETFERLLQAVAGGRRQPPERIRSLIDEGPFTSTQALAKGLVDGLLHQDQVFEEIQSRLRLPRLRKVGAAEYRRVSATSLGLEGRARIAVIAAAGMIVRGSVPRAVLGDGLIGSEDFAALLAEVAGDERIRGVIVRIDSPGGDATASEEIWRQMSLLSKKKPLVISLSDSAASGGYYIALTGDPILAYPGTVTGSIGVFYGKANLRGLYEKLGIRKEILQRGRFAALDSDYFPLGAEGRAKLSKAVEDSYRVFLSRVAESRRRSLREIEALAEGRIWLGSQAARLGLVDEIGGLDRAVELIKKRAQIPEGEPVRLVSYPARRSWIEWLWESGGQASESWLAPIFRHPAARVWQQGGVWRLQPYEVVVK